MSKDYGSLFDSEYFRTACGPVPYERNEQWLAFFRRVARNIVHTLKPSRVLDAGCAMGLLVESLWDLGVEARGLDISSYAISQVRKDMQPCCAVGSLADPIQDRYDLITCIEVLEHMPAAEAEAAIANLCRAADTILFSSTPFDFDEPTHCNVRPLLSWLRSFAAHGFRAELAYDASFITQHAVLLQRSEAPWPDEVVALFCRSVYQKAELVSQSEQISRLTSEASLHAARARQLESDRDSAGSRYVEIAGRFDDLERRHTGALEATARLEQERDAGRRDLAEAAAALEQLRGDKADLETALRDARRRNAEEIARLRAGHQALQSAMEEISRHAAAREEALQAELSQARAELDAAGQTIESASQNLAGERRLAQSLTADVTAARADLERAAAERETSRRQWAAERRNLDTRLEKTAEELARSRHEGKALAGVVQDLRELYDSASRELLAIKTSPGWRAIEEYRAWRQRTVARRTWLAGRYESAVGHILRWAGVAAEDAPRAFSTFAPKPISAPPAPFADGQASPPAPEIARFALIIGGCPGDAFRYRCEHQAEALRFTGLTADTATFDNVDYTAALDRYEMFILHRVPHTPGVEEFIARARALGRPVLFDTDDLIFNEALLGEIRAIRNFSREEYDLYVSGVRRYCRTLSLCSGALVTTPTLCDAVKELFPALPVWVNRNAASDSMVARAGHALDAIPRPDDNLVRIAYFSGTRTHQDDFAQCVPALVRLLKTYRQVRLGAVGHLDVPDALRRLGGQVETTPLVPWQDLPALMRRVDINLAPLEPDNRFTAAKSELKYFEAALLGVPTIASDTPAFRDAITPGRNGLLCRTDNEWFEALETLVLDPQLRARLGEQARQDALARYTTRSRAPQFVAVLRDVFHQLARRRERMSVAFVLRAPIAQTSGGYKTIFSLAHFLAGRGHDVHLYVEPIAHLAGKSDPEIVDFCRRAFGDSSARIHVGHHAIRPSDVAIATNWPTAYIVDRLTNARAKAYLVQDFEPEFYDRADPNYRGAERTYDLPLKKIAIGKYLAGLFSARDRLPAAHFPFFLDPSIYSNLGVRPEAPPVRILFFARPGLKRRAYPVGVEALRIVARTCPGALIALYGAAAPPDVEFPYENLGELSRQQVAAEMNRSHIHLSFSLTNISWAPFEAMACGCAVVEAKAPPVETWMDQPEQHCLLAEPHPDAVAAAIIRLVTNPALRNRIARSGEQHVATISATRQEAGSRFELILQETICLETPKGATVEHRSHEACV